MTYEPLALRPLASRSRLRVDGRVHASWSSSGPFRCSWGLRLRRPHGVLHCPRGLLLAVGALTSSQKVRMETRGRVGVAEGEVARIFARGGGRHQQRRGHHRRNDLHLLPAPCTPTCWPACCTTPEPFVRLPFLVASPPTKRHTTSRRRCSLRAGVFFHLRMRTLHAHTTGGVRLKREVW